MPVQTLRVDKSVRRLYWLPLGDTSPALLRAIVLSEDKRFHEHSGVDWQAVASSAWANLWNTRTRGASTLTMQLAGLIDEGLARPAGGRSVVQKIGQAVTATVRYGSGFSCAACGASVTTGSTTVAGAYRAAHASACALNHGSLIWRAT